MLYRAVLCHAVRLCALLCFRGDVGKYRLPVYSRGIRQRLYRLHNQGNWSSL